MKRYFCEVLVDGREKVNQKKTKNEEVKLRVIGNKLKGGGRGRESSILQFSLFCDILRSIYFFSWVEDASEFGYYGGLKLINA